MQPVVQTLETLPQIRKSEVEKILVNFDDLLPGMITTSDVLSKDGTIIIEKNQEITLPIIQGLQNFINHMGLQEPIEVWKYSAL